MKFPLTITFHNTRRTAQAEADVREHAERLDKYHKRLQSCEVIIDKPHHHQNKGNQYHVKILLSVPGQKLSVTSTSPKHGDHTNLHNALRDAFEAARRQLRAQKDKPRELRIRKRQRGIEAEGMMSAPA